MSSIQRRFIGEKDSYLQIELLGAGQTAEVYRVRSERDYREWALKLLGEAIYQKRFFDEVLTLRQLAPYARAENDRGSFLLVPEVFDVQEAGPDRFIVMTLARGQRLDELLLERERLGEPEALTILLQTAQVFEALHQQLRRDYHDFQPRNIYWDKEQQQVLVLDWNLLSPEGKVNVANDVLALGKLLYRMLVGEQLPALGVTAAPGWEGLTLGAQTILRKATHQDVRQRYASIAALRSDCRQQLMLWEMKADNLLTDASDAYDRGKDIKNKAPGPEFLACKAALDEARNCMQILEARESELSTTHRTLFLTQVRPSISQSWTENTQIAAGRRFLHTYDSGQARSVFDDIISRSDDVAERLRAMRWRLAAVPDKPSRDVLIEACDLIEVGELDEASQRLAGAARLGASSQIATLRADTDAQRAWRDAGVWLARAEQTANPQDYAEAAARMERTQQALGRLDAEQRAAYTALWGDIATLHAETSAKAHKLNEQHNELRERREDWAGKPPAAVIAAVEEELRTAPPGAGVRAPIYGLSGIASSTNGAQETAAGSRAATAALALEFVRRWTDEAITAHGGGAKLQDAVQLIEIALPYVGAAERPPAVAEWRQLKAAAALLEQPQPPGKTPTVHRWLDELVQRTQPPAGDKLAAYVLEQLMAGAEGRLDAPLAALVVEFAERLDPGARSRYSARRDAVAAKLAALAQDAEAAFLQRIDDAERVNTVEALGAARQLIDEQLARAPEGSDWRARLAERSRRVADAQTVVRLKEQLAVLQDRVTATESPVTLASLKGELLTLRNDARQLASLPGAGELAEECERQLQNIEQRRWNFGQFNAQRQAAQQYYQEYQALRDLRQDQPASPLRREYALALLARARHAAQQAGELAPAQPDIVKLQGELEQAWRREGGELDKQALPADAAAELAALSAQQANLQTTLHEVAEQVSTGQQAARAVGGGGRLPWPLTALLAALLLLAAAGAGLTWWMGSQNAAALAQTRQEIGGLNTLATPVAGLAADVAGVRAEVAALAAALPAPGSSEADIAADIAAAVTAAVAPVEARALEAEQRAGAAEARAVTAEGQAATLAATLTAEQAAVAPTVAAVATTLASFQAMGIQLTAQAEALAARTAELDQREGALVQAAVALSATATALAAAPVVSVTPTPEPPTPMPPTPAAGAPEGGAAAAVGEPGPEVVAGATVTATETVTDSAAVTPTVSYTVTFSFPAEGAQLYTAPWQIDVRGDPWPEEFDSYRLYVNDALLDESARPEAAEPITFVRSIAGNWDVWAQMTPAGRAALNLDDNGQLPPGGYTLRLLGMSTDDREQEVAQVSFTILSEPAPEAVVVPNDGIARRLGPSMEASRTQDGSVTPNATVSVLGKAYGTGEENNVVLWCLWQTQDNNVRRGWTQCRYLENAAGVTLDQDDAGIPWLTPSEPVTSS